MHTLPRLAPLLLIALTAPLATADIGPRRLVAATGTQILPACRITHLQESPSIDPSTGRVWFESRVEGGAAERNNYALCIWSDDKLEPVWLPRVIIPAGIPKDATCGLPPLLAAQGCNQFVTQVHLWGARLGNSWWHVAQGKATLLGDQDHGFPCLPDAGALDPGSVSCRGIDARGRVLLSTPLQLGLERQTVLLWGRPDALRLLAPEGARPIGRDFRIHQIRIWDTPFTRNGTVWIVADIRIDDQHRDALLRVDDGTPKVVFTAGGPAPGFEPGWTVEDIQFVEPNDRGDALIMANCTKPIEGEQGVWGCHACFMLHANEATLVFRRDKTPAGWPRPEKFQIGNYGTPSLRLTHDGTAMWLAQLRHQDPQKSFTTTFDGFAVCEWKDKGVHPVLRTDDTVPDLAPDQLSCFYGLSVNDAGHVLTLATLRSRGSALLARRRGGQWAVLARSGETVDLPGVGPQVVKQITIAPGSGGDTCARSSLSPQGLVVCQVEFEPVGNSPANAAIFAQQLD